MLILFPLLIKLKSADHRIDPSYQQKIAGYFPIVNQSKDCVNNRIYAKNNRAYFALLQVYPQAHPQHDNNIDQKIWTLQYKNTQNNGKGCTDITDDCITVQLFLKVCCFREAAETLSLSKQQMGWATGSVGFHNSYRTMHHLHKIGHIVHTVSLPYLKYLSSRPLNALPCRASSRAIS